MATKVWTGFVSFGLLSIPVYLNVAARDKKVQFHTFHVACDGPVSKPNRCAACDVELQKTEIYRGFSGPNGTIRITDEELEGLSPKTEKIMEISECVPWSSIDPIYLAESFWLLPEPAGAKAYSLLQKSLTESGRVAIAQITKNGREHTVALRPKGNGIAMHYLWYADEVAEVPEFEKFQPVALNANEIKLAKQLLDSLEAGFDPDKYEDSYRQRLNTLIASKTDKSIEAPKPVNVVVKPSVDVTAALMASLAAVRPKPPKREAVKQNGKKGRGKSAA